jgi:molybdopterin converting factor small subunit
LTLGFMAEVRFLGELRKAAGVATFGIDAHTVGELLEQLGRVMGPAFQEFVFEGARLQQDVEVLVNGGSISLPDGMKTALTPFDQVSLSIRGGRRLSGG